MGPERTSRSAVSGREETAMPRQAERRRSHIVGPDTPGPAILVAPPAGYGSWRFVRLDRVAPAHGPLIEDAGVPPPPPQRGAEELRPTRFPDIREKEQIIAGVAGLRDLHAGTPDADPGPGRERIVRYSRGGHVFPRVARVHGPALAVELLDGLDRHDQKGHPRVVLLLLVPVAVEVPLHSVDCHSHLGDRHLRETVLVGMLPFSAELVHSAP